MEKKKQTIIITVAAILLLLLLSLAIALPLALRGKDETGRVKVTVTTHVKNIDSPGVNFSVSVNKWFLKSNNTTTEHAGAEDMSFSPKADEEVYFGLLYSLETGNSGYGSLKEIEYDNTKIELSYAFASESYEVTSEKFEEELGTAAWKTYESRVEDGGNMLLLKIKVKDTVEEGDLSITLKFEGHYSDAE